MMHPEIAYGIASEHRNDMIAQATSSAKARDAQRVSRSNRGRSAASSRSFFRISLRPRTA
jgi:hypothetical protein